MLLFLVVIGAANWTWWRLRANQRAQRQQSTESQLRLLQAQIEPHFLFNTLANVQSLIGHDTPGARQMLVDFTDYLRVGLVQLRHADSTRAAYRRGGAPDDFVGTLEGFRVALDMDGTADGAAKSVPSAFAIELAAEQQKEREKRSKRAEIPAR